MKIEKDKNNLLTIFNENIPQTKEYTYHASGYTFSDFDKWMIVLHKKERKIINLKNLGDNMNVVYMKSEKKSEKKTLNTSMFEDVLMTFKWFNEETGEKYYFIPGLWEKDIQEKNAILKKFSACEIKKTPRGVMVELQHATQDTQQGDILSYLFGLIVIYGKFDGKKWELNSIKIQIPLAGQFMAHQERFDDMIKKLQTKGIFIKADKLPNKNGIVYQISSNDYELLEIFAHRYEPVEKFEKITKREFTEEMKTKLIEFISTNPEIPQEGKAEVLKQIKTWAIKLLTK